MKQKTLRSLESHFKRVTDPRGPNIEHLLMDIILIAILGVISGANGWVEIEQFGRQKEKWLRKYLRLPHGIPSHDTFGRVFGLIDAAEFQASFRSWVAVLREVTDGEVIGIDGKQMRGSKDKKKDKAGLYMVSAWAEANHLVLGQRQVDAKSNEITAIPALLKLIEIKGCIVTIDAIGTQTKIAKQIIEGGGDYLLEVKENQKKLYEDMGMLWDSLQQFDFQETAYTYDKEVKKGHGRIDVREGWVTAAPEYLKYLRTGKKWKGLRTLAFIRRKRIIDGEATETVHFFISSLPPNAERLVKASRQHWGIENGLHWVLDIAFNEDRSRVRTGNAPANLAVLRHMAVNLLKQETTAKGGIKAKRLQAAWNEDYLFKVLQLA
jgi:predicted transposase YbfD/YdcC